MLEVDPAIIVENIYSNSELCNEDKENGPSVTGLPKEDVLNQLNLIGMPSFDIDKKNMFQEYHHNSSNYFRVKLRRSSEAM